MALGYRFLKDVSISVWSNIEKCTEDRPIAKYEKIVRYEGIGKIRIGTRLELRDDCYGYVVLTMLNEKILDKKLNFKNEVKIKRSISLKDKENDVQSQ